MEAPHVAGLRIRHLIGSGGCGSVHLAEAADGGWYAVKILDGMAIARGLLARMAGRLGAGGWPAEVVPVVLADYDNRPAYQVTPWLADGDPEEGGRAVPRTLQSSLGDYPGENSWPLVRALATALAAMHERQVAHGNLKPGNVFFDAAGTLQLADWALGNMPGVARFEFTDALLYQPPEQLLDAAGYLAGDGYRWDVFAFGVLAFRVLTGRFPRCHDLFSQVAPEPGEARREGIHADLPQIALNLAADPEIAWPDEPRNGLEAGFRTWVGRCLALDPVARPATMQVVAAGLAEVATQVATEEERERLLDHRRRADRRAWRAFVAAGVTAAAALGFGALWQLTHAQLRRERTERKSEHDTLREQAATAVAARKLADQQVTGLTGDLKHAAEVARNRLAASRLIGDRLFAWAMEKGHRQLPPLDGRDQRLKILTRYYQEFLTGTAADQELAGEHSRVRLQLAEIALAEGNADAATQRLTEALKDWEGQPLDPDLNLRLATNRLLLALLRQANGDPAAAAAFADARKSLAGLPPAVAENHADRLNQLTAILDFHEARLLAANGQDGKALDQLLKATSTLNRLADQRPDAAVLRSDLAACYLSSATILEGMGNLGDAREVRTLAEAELTQLLKKTPADFALRLELAGCYGAMAESAVLAGDTTGAEGLSKVAMKLLEKLAAEQPDNSEVVARMAAQIGVGAGLMRDRGQATAASQAFDEGIRLLEGVRAAKPGDALVGYRLALLWWQKGRMLGTSGKHAEEIRLIVQARTLLAKLEAERNAGGPPLEQLQRSLAYLLGDLGHVTQLAGQRDEAKQAFGDAIGYWECLLKSRPLSEEYEEGCAWCRQRLQELQ
jgi:hypothetical protein